MAVRVDLAGQKAEIFLFYVRFGLDTELYIFVEIIQLQKTMLVLPMNTFHRGKFVIYSIK